VIALLYPEKFYERNGYLQLFIYVAVLLAAKPLGSYMAPCLQVEPSVLNSHRASVRDACSIA
jgi:hypothetical protein